MTRLWFSLQDNGTTDATSVVFDDFTVATDAITLECQETVIVFEPY